MTDENENQENFEQLKQLQEQLGMIEKIAKQKMTKEAISRYGNIKLAHPEKAIKAITTVAQLQEEIDDDKFKQILRKL